MFVCAITLDWLLHPKYTDQIWGRFGCGDKGAGPLLFAWWDLLRYYQEIILYGFNFSTSTLNIPFGAVAITMFVAFSFDTFTM
jgi:hypothetical protein